MGTEPNAVVAAFERAKAGSRALLIGYWPAGFPDEQSSIEMVETMLANGVDAVEIGLPYTDPVMDGPVIAEAAEVALANGATHQTAFDVVAAVSGTDAPILAMTYWNLIEQFGPGAFAAELARAGGAGVITPDLPAEEAEAWVAASNTADVARVFLAAPSSTQQRLDVVADASSGFVYAASLMGVTGTRDSVSGDARELVARLRAVTDLPIAVGLGVSTREQAAQVAAYADGVIVGSAFVRQVLDHPDLQSARRAVADLAADLARGVAEGYPA
ncbi:MAG: tryptophan synthase subunit alpha [Actinomycetia bacterium]|nr:tryptophan synthase subunit alpha [Actinomycetes bacterium]